MRHSVVNAAVALVLCLFASSCAATTTGTPSAGSGTTVATAPPTVPTSSPSPRSESAPTRSPDARAATTAPVPPTFIAIAGRTGEGIVLVETATGRVVRRLAQGPPGGGPSNLDISSDRRIVYFSRGDGTCAGHLAKVSVSGGDETSISRGHLRDSVEGRPAVRPDGRKIAFVREYCRRNLGQSGLVIADFGPDGVRESQRLHPVRETPVAWSPDGRLLAVSGPDSAVWEVDDSGSILNRYPIRSPSTECRFAPTGFQPGSGLLLAGQLCGPSGPSLESSLLLLDPRSGAVRRKLLDAPRGSAFLWTSFDASGNHLLYSMVRSNPQGCVIPTECPNQPYELYRFSEGQSVKIAGDSAFEQAVW